MRKVGSWNCAFQPMSHEDETDCRIWRHLPNGILMSSVSFSTIRGEKMCKHKHALKGKMIRGIQKRSSPDPMLIQIQLFLSAGKQSSLFISHMARPSCYWHWRGRDAEKTIRVSWGADQYGKDYPEHKLALWYSCKMSGHFTFPSLADSRAYIILWEVHHFKSTINSKQSHTITGKQDKDVQVASLSPLVGESQLQCFFLLLCLNRQSLTRQQYCESTQGHESSALNTARVKVHEKVFVLSPCKWSHIDRHQWCIKLISQAPQYEHIKKKKRKWKKSHDTAFERRELPLLYVFTSQSICHDC